MTGQAAVDRWDEERDGPVSQAAPQERLEQRGDVMSRDRCVPGTEVMGGRPVISLDAVKRG